MIFSELHLQFCCEFVKTYHKIHFFYFNRQEENSVTQKTFSPMSNRTDYGRVVGSEAAASNLIKHHSLKEGLTKDENHSHDIPTASRKTPTQLDDEIDLNFERVTAEINTYVARDKSNPVDEMPPKSNFVKEPDTEVPNPPVRVRFTIQKPKQKPQIDHSITQQYDDKVPALPSHGDLKEQFKYGETKQSEIRPEGKHRHIKDMDLESEERTSHSVEDDYSEEEEEDEEENEADDTFVDDEDLNQEVAAAMEKYFQSEEKTNKTFREEKKGKRLADETPKRSYAQKKEKLEDATTILVDIKAPKHTVMSISADPRTKWTEYKDAFSAHEKKFGVGNLGDALPKEKFHATVSSIFAVARTAIWPRSKLDKTDEVVEQGKIARPWFDALKLEDVYDYDNTGFFAADMLRILHRAFSWNYSRVTVPDSGNYKCVITGRSIQKDEECYLFVVWSKSVVSEDHPIPYYYYISKHEEHEEFYLAQVLAFCFYRYYHRFMILEVKKWKKDKAPKGKNLTDEQRLAEFMKDFGQITDLITSYTFLHNLVKGKIIKSHD